MQEYISVRARKASSLLLAFESYHYAPPWSSCGATIHLSSSVLPTTTGCCVQGKSLPTARDTRNLPAHDKVGSSLECGEEKSALLLGNADQCYGGNASWRSQQGIQKCSRLGHSHQKQLCRSLLGKHAAGSLCPQMGPMLERKIELMLACCGGRAAALSGYWTWHVTFPFCAGIPSLLKTEKLLVLECCFSAYFQPQTREFILKNYKKGKKNPNPE